MASAVRLREQVERVIPNAHSAARITDAFLQALLLRVFGVLRPLNPRMWTSQRVSDALDNALRCALLVQELRDPRLERMYNFLRLPLGSREFWESLAWCAEAAVIAHPTRGEWRPRTPSELQRYLDVFVRSPSRKGQWPLVARVAWIEESGVLAVRYSTREPSMSDLQRLQNAIVKLVEEHIVFEPLDLAGTGVDAPIPRAWTAVKFVADACTADGYAMSPNAAGLALMYVIKLLHKQRAKLPMNFVRTCLQGIAYDTAQAVRANRRPKRANAHYLVEDLRLERGKIVRVHDLPTSANMKVIERAAKRVVGVFVDLLTEPDSSLEVQVGSDFESRRSDFYQRLRVQFSGSPLKGGFIEDFPELPLPPNDDDDESPLLLEAGGAAGGEQVFMGLATLDTESDWGPASEPETSTKREATPESPQRPTDIEQFASAASSGENLLPEAPEAAPRQAAEDSDGTSESTTEPEEDSFEGGRRRHRRKLPVRQGDRRTLKRKLRIALRAGDVEIPWGSTLGSEVLQFL